MRRLTNEQYAEAKQLCDEMPLIEARLFRCGLFQTGHAMNKAVQSIGWELAKCSPHGTKRRRKA